MPRRRAKSITGHQGVRRIETRSGEKAFYRITGFINSAGEYVARRPSNGHWYVRASGRHYADRPTREELIRSPRIWLEIEDAEGNVTYRTRSQ